MNVMLNQRNVLNPPVMKSLLSPVLAALVVILALGVAAVGRSAQSATGVLRGAVSVIGPDGQPLSVAAVQLKLSGAPLGSSSLSTFSTSEGEYKFIGLPAGSYTLEASLQGFKNFVKAVSLPAPETVVEDIRLEIEELRESVTVQAETVGIATKEAAPAEELKQDTIQTIPLATERFTEALPLIPGVVRGPDGLLNVKGARASQSGLLVNSANVTDPATGEYAINLPIDVIQSLQVLTNPYAPEYGKFTGGVTSIETRRGGDKWKVQLTNFFPRFRRRGGSFVGLQSVTPRLMFTGPLRKDKVKFLQAFEYRFNRAEVEFKGFPPLQRDKKLESFDSFTQLDWDLNAANHVSTVFSLFPQKLEFVNLDTFNPQVVTANFKQRGFLWGINERMVLSNRSLLESYFSIKQFDANIFPSSGNEIMNFAPNRNSGNFFNRQDRETRRYEGLEIFNFSPPNFAGSHLMKVAAGVSYTTFDGRNVSNAVRILRANGTRSAQIDFVGDGKLDRNKTEFLTYFQDKWSASNRLTLEYGVRYDRDTIAEDNNFAPRLGFAFLPILDGRTVVRGGVGLFYDKTNFNVATFEQLQERVLTRFGPDGVQLTGAPLRQRFVLDKNEFRTPRSVNWNVELDREWMKNLFIREETHHQVARRFEGACPFEIEKVTGMHQQMLPFQ